MLCGCVPAQFPGVPSRSQSSRTGEEREIGARCGMRPSRFHNLASRLVSSVLQSESVSTRTVTGGPRRRRFHLDVTE
jgi:hypothetical protein